MEIKNIDVHNDGYVFCKSCFYSVQDILECDVRYTFSTGINKMIGEIDSGIWAISYLLSMYKYRPKDFVIFDQPIAVVNGKTITLNDLSELSCYMDKSFPLFAKKVPVKKLVAQGLKKRKLSSEYLPDDIRELFRMDSKRFERPISGVGNERFKAMAAIGFCYGKEIFCFPWLSSMRFDYYHQNMTGLLDILNELKKVVIVPVGAATASPV